ncbi:hypothetical protein PO124_12955 [Bacillus licheniformis]|nr:hypothetical protein [Bacillus licheniformis]
MLTEGEALTLENVECRAWTDRCAMGGTPSFRHERIYIASIRIPASQRCFIVKTGKVKLHVQLNGFRISWFYHNGSEWINVANDRQTQGYNLKGLLERACTIIYNAMSRNNIWIWRETGNVDKHGKRYRMLNIDAMGTTQSGQIRYTNISHSILHVIRNRHLLWNVL